MKKILLVILFATPFFVWSQTTFTLSQKSVELSAPNAGEVQGSTSMTNNATNPNDTVFQWKVVEYTNPTEWTLAFCDPFFCNTDTRLDSSNFFNLGVGRNGLLKGDIYFNGKSGLGVMKIQIKSILDSSNVDTFTMTATAWLTSVRKTAAPKSLTVYPNPAKDYITIDIPSKSAATIDVYNVLGSKVKSITHENGASVKVDINDLQKGVYFIRVSEKGAVFTKQFNKTN